jgi:hypothetical protein
MTITKELVESFQPVSYSRVQRGETSYHETYELTVSELDRLVGMYKTLTTAGQTARLLRDSIDHWIRRYHKYAIQGKINSHYHQRGVSLVAKDCIFEHVIPASTVRDKLIAGELTINQALNVPTCRVSRNVDTLLRKKGLHDSTPDGWFFFKRYQIALSDIDIETYNGQIVKNLDTWTLQNHFDFFGIV